MILRLGRFQEDLLVGEEVVVARKVSSVFNVTFEIPVRHSGKDMKNAVGELSLDFRGEIWADTNSNHI